MLDLQSRLIAANYIYIPPQTPPLVKEGLVANLWFATCGVGMRCGGRCVALSSDGVGVRCCTFGYAGDSGYAGEVGELAKLPMFGSVG